MATTEEMALVMIKLVREGVTRYGKGSPEVAAAVVEVEAWAQDMANRAWAVWSDWQRLGTDELATLLEEVNREAIVADTAAQIARAEVGKD